MKNKIVMITSALAVMMAMTGIAAADPEKVNWYDDGTTTNIDSPQLIPNDGINSFNFDLSFYDMISSTPADATHNLNAYIVVLSGTGALDTDVTIKLCESSKMGSSPDPNCVTGTGTVGTPLTLTWYQDLAGNQIENIDVKLTSGGPDNARYQLYIDDVYQYGIGATGTALFDNAGESSEFQNVPEFATVAIPIAAVLGLVFFFQQKKNKKE